MYELCRYLLASGRRCTQPAVTGGPYCRHHGVVRRTVASSIVPPQFHHLHRALPFLYPEDRASIQANCFLVMRALDDRRISTQTANAFNRLLRTCQANLKPGPLHESENEKKSDGVGLSGEDNAGAPIKPDSQILGGPLKPNVGLSGEDNAGAPRLDSETWGKQSDPALVRRVVLTPAGEELAPPLEVWEEGEGQHPRAAAPEPHHPDCRCAQCPKPDQLQTVGAPCLEETWDQSDGVPLNPDLQISGGPLPGSPRTGLSSWGGHKPAVGLSGGQDQPAFNLNGGQDTSNLIEDDDPYAFYEGDPIPPDPYAAKETEEERKQNRERREQILDKHKDRLDKVEKQYLYTPQLADRIRDEIQQIMELEMGHEAFSYQLLPPPAS